MSKILQHKEPITFAQANMDPVWQRAMQDEISALKSSNTWELTELPHGKKPIASK